ncbi:molybdenum cofactor guanylyltransferase [Roseivirga sp. E12]|uniref:molybdenum cofactor guanylyltransferase n=1 Tax=Roseivirga sp. E12 TaxID=2819237 RepID=UPI001B253F0A|nr:molybdenum cofactor guanylyltransferase [Roseivirga sp. E12]MBO3697589.1 molybdenum cofactor guanylyltransferase [Roseivirga sp. E12]
MSESAVKGLILIGGRSSRMGSDKAFVTWKDMSLLEHSVEILSGITDQVYLSVNSDQHKVLSAEYECIEDRYENMGPLGGILSALEFLQEDLIVMAVDMPQVGAQLLEELIIPGKFVRAYQTDDNKWEPLPSYWPKTSIRELKSHFSTNQLSIKSFLDLHGQGVSIQTDSGSFKNLNRPSDLT